MIATYQTRIADYGERSEGDAALAAYAARYGKVHNSSRFGRR